MAEPLVCSITCRYSDACGDREYMESFHRHSRRSIRNNVFVWDSNFTSRQQQSYASDHKRIVRQPGESAADAFLNWERSGLCPPLYNYAALRELLDKAKETDLHLEPVASQYAPEVALVDDRCDRTGWKDIMDRHHAARDWNLYARYPPSEESQQSRLLNASGLFKLLAENVRMYPVLANNLLTHWQRQLTGAERRTM